MASKFLKEFREFAVKGNVVDMAVGIIIGGAFTLIVQSLVKNIFNPVIGLLIGGVDFGNFFVTLKDGATPGTYNSLSAAQAAGAVTLDYGLFLNAVISFIIVAFVVFLLVRSINRMKREEAVAPKAPTDKACPHCFMTIPIMATKCGHCTADLPLESPAQEGTVTT